MPGPERQFRPLYFALLATFALFGVSVSAIGATLPKILDGFRWSYVGAGCVLAAGSIGYFVAAFVSGLLAARVGPKRVMVAGLLLQAAGMLLFVRWPSVALNVAVYFFAGVGQGGQELVTNYSVVRMQRDGRSRLMNLMHAAFTVGAILGPLVAAALIGWGRSGREIYAFIGMMCLLLAWLHASLDYGVLGTPESEGRAGARATALLREPLLVLSFFVLLLYVGSELGVSNWVGEYYVKVLGASPAVGAYMVGVFWLGLLVGRAGL